MSKGLPNDQRRGEMPEVWEGAVPEERAEVSLGLADVYEGPDLGLAADLPVRSQEAGEGLEQIYEAVRRSEAPHGEGAEDEDETGDGGEVTFGLHGGAVEAAIGGPHVLSRDTEAASAARVELARPDVVLMHHVVTPVATIAMVGALLFYLLDLRSVFVPGSFSLKWMGLCFVVATVLIARYGRLLGPWGYQRLYTAALAAATFVAMAMSPWEPPQTRIWGPLCNAVVLWVVWRYATGLTENLSIDLDTDAPKRRTLFGLERLALETWRRQRSAAGKASSRPGARAVRAGGPAVLRAVGVLVLTTLAVFAFGEPILLLADSEVKARALSAMVCFFLAAAVLLAAASTVAQQRRLRAMQATAPWTLVTGRVALALVLALFAVSLGLQLPGLTQAGAPPEVRIDRDEQGPRDAAVAQPPAAAGSDRAPGGERFSDPAVTRSASRPAAQLKSFELVPSLSELGRLFLWPAFGIAAALALWALGARVGRQERLWPVVRGDPDRIRMKLRAASAALWKWLGPRARLRRRKDPLASLDELKDEQPARAVVGAYSLLQSALADLGHARLVDQTPIEYLRSIPGTMSRLRPAAERLTRLYLLAAYAQVDLADAQRKQALEALEELRLAAKLHAREIRGR